MNAHKGHLIAIGVLLGIFLITFSSLYVSENRFQPPFPSGSDLSVHVPMVLKTKNSDLFSPRDEFISNYATFFPGFYWKALSLAPDVHSALLVGTVFLNIIFLIGVYFFIFTFTHDKFCAVFFAVLSLKAWPAFNTLQWGGIWPEMVLPRTIVMAFSPFLLTGMLVSKKIWLDALIALSIGLLFHAHPMASHLMILWVIALWFREDTPHMKSFLKSFFLVSFFFFLGALPALKGVLVLTFGKFFSMTGGSGAKLEIVPERSLHFLQFDPKTLLAFFFNLMPFLLLSVVGSLWGIFGGISGKSTRYRTAFFAQMATVFAFSFGFLVLGQFNPRWAIGEFPRMSIYFYLFSFLFAAYGLITLRQVKKGWFVAAVALLLLHHGTTYGLVLQEVAPNTRLAKMFEKKPRDQWIDASFLALCEFVKENTPKDAVFVVPPGREMPKLFDLFRVYAVRSIVVHWKGIYSRKDWDLFVATEAAYNHARGDSLVQIAHNHLANYIVIPSSIDSVLQDQAFLDKPIVYRNNIYSLVKVN